MYEDIDKFVESYEGRIMTLEEYVDQEYSKQTVKVWKLESVYKNGFVYVVGNTKHGAIKHVKKNLHLNTVFVKCELAIDVMDDFIPNMVYVWLNTIPLPKFKEPSWFYKKYRNTTYNQHLFK